MADNRIFKLWNSIRLPLFLVLIYSLAFYFFHKYDWEHPIVKAVCFIAIFLMILFIYKKGTPSITQNSYLKKELIIILALIVIVLFTLGLKYLKEIKNPSKCDVGYTTHDAAKLLVFDNQNPYKSTTINKLVDEPKFQGYHYGPAMILFYLPSAWFSSATLKTISLIYLILLFFVMSSLFYERKNSIIY